MNAADLVVVDLADENTELRDRLCLTESYRELAQAALSQLAERNAELERARRRIAMLVGELRALRETTVAA